MNHLHRLRLWWNGRGSPGEPDWTGYQSLMDGEYQLVKGTMDGFCRAVFMYRSAGYRVVPFRMTMAGADLVRVCGIAFDEPGPKTMFIRFRWWTEEPIPEAKPGDLVLSYWPTLNVRKP